MKTLNTLISLSLIVISTASFASTDVNRSEENTKIPVAPSVWESPEIEAPESLKFLKAKNAYVPVSSFVWGDPSEAPAILTIVPVAPFVLGGSMENTPEELSFIKAKYAHVPVAPFIWGDPSEAPAELFIK